MRFLLKSFFSQPTLVFVAICLNIYPINPILKGTYPQDTPLGKVCLQIKIPNDEKKDQSRLLLGSVTQIIQFTYTFYFYWRIRRYVRKYGRKLCAIGKYKRNCNTLKTTAPFAILGCCFPNFNYLFRDVITRSDASAQLVFIAQFLFADLCIDLFYTSLYFLSANDDIPSIEETPRRILFYVSRPKYLEPRRPESIGANPTSKTPKTCTVKPSDFRVPSVTVIRNEHKVTLYHAAFKKKVPKDDYTRKGQTVQEPKLTKVSPWSDEDQVGRRKTKTKLEKEVKKGASEKDYDVIEKFNTEEDIIQHPRSAPRFRYIKRF